MDHPVKDLTGRLFAGGRWRVTGFAGMMKGRRDATWTVVCVECGQPSKRRLRGCDLRTKGVRCYICRPILVRQPADGRRKYARHGMTKTHRKEYHAWGNMNQRCTNPRHPKYPLYGGRGIQVCERWRGSFKNFFDDLGPAPFKKASIDRIDGDGHYEPGNVRWASYSEQNSHLKRTGTDDEIGW